MAEDSIEKIIEKYRNQESALTHILFEIQKEFNGIPKVAMLKISKQLNIPTAEICRIQNDARIEQYMLQGTEDEDLGVYSELFSAKSCMDGQDGGIVTALLVSGMKKGVFDAVIVIQRTEGYRAEATIAKNIQEIVAARGTKYLKVRITPKLRELVDQGKKKIAVVCTPCEVRAVRKLQQILKRDAPEVEITVIGLFCLEAFDYGKLKVEVERCTGVDIDKAEKTLIHKGRFIVRFEGKEYTCKVRDLDKAVEKGCHYCSDFSARIADISVGSVGSQSGYSTVIVRSDAGKKMLQDLDIIKVKAEKQEIIKLSKSKREHAKKASLP
jgi:coenzyme F420-reducing hydrogenase beta subunit